MANFLNIAVPWLPHLQSGDNELVNVTHLEKFQVRNKDLIMVFYLFFLQFGWRIGSSIQ